MRKPPPLSSSRVTALAIVLAATFTVATAETVSPDREFEHRVRSLFFRGLDGDLESFEAAMTLCEAALVVDPNDAEALVWRGSGTFYQAGRAFQAGDWATGTTLWRQGLEEMDRAVELAPDDVAVRIPRGATLLGASRSVPSADQARPLLVTAAADYERVLEVQSAYFDKLSEHARGELLIGLIEAYARLGEDQRAMEHVARLQREVADSEYARRVDEALTGAGGLVDLRERTCSGCHH